MLQTPDTAQYDTERRVRGGPQRWSVATMQVVPEGALVAEGEPDDGAFDPQRSYLLGKFRAYYAELSRLKRAALRDLGSLASPVPGDATPIHDVRDTARTMSLRLQHVLEQLALEAAVHGGELGAAKFRDAQYAMAALADEIFLHLDWPGREAWLDTMLERALFGTQIAGEDFFRRIDDLLPVRTGASVDVATVYFMVLGLGFEGRYRGRDGSILGGYRARLYRFLYRHESGHTNEVLAPQAYAHTLRGSRPARLPLVQRWAIILAVAITAYLVASQLIWHELSAGLRETSKQILLTAPSTRRVAR
jgi:type VI secretion system protein ImpK